MKTTFAAALLLLFLYAPALAAVIENHDLQLELRPEQHLLLGTDRLVVRPEGSRSLQLSLAPQAEVLAVQIDGQATKADFRAGKLAVELPADRQKVPMEIRYRATFADPAPIRPLNSEDPGFGVAATIGEAGVYLGGGAGWYPDDGQSRPTFRLTVKTPAELLAVTSGRLVGEKPGESVWQIDQPVQGLALSAGAYEKRTTPAAIPVSTYFYPQSRSFAETYLQAATRYLDLYGNLFGPYPFEKFAVVENFFPTGYGYPSWTLLGSSVVSLPFIVETSLGHEIAHSWWGNGVWVDYARGNWSEGLTTYVADHLYKERQSAAEGRDYRLKILRDYSSLVTAANDFPLATFRSRSTAAEQAVGYGKTAMVFHMARMQVGDEAFWAALRQLAREKMFAPASWTDFAAALGKAGKTDLGPFFRQWVNRPGAPRLLLREVKMEKTPAGWAVSGFIRQHGPLYTLRLPLLLETENGPVQAVLTARGATTSFRLETTGRPQRLTADPDVDVFRRLEPAEIPPTVNAVRGSTGLLAIAAADLPPETLEPARLLLPALGLKSTEVRPEATVRPVELQGRDILFLGLPTRKELRPLLPSGLQIDERQIILEGDAYSGPEISVFTTFPRADDPRRLGAIFLPGAPATIEAVVRKIPHYGKYSYLVFSSETNVAKGIWPPQASPLVHVFTP